MTLPTAGLEPPFWCVLLASFLRQRGVEVSIIDAEVENLTAKETAERVCSLSPRLTALVVQGQNPSATSTPKMDAVHALLEELDGRFLTALLGIHPSALPDRTMAEEKVDFVIRGEGFYTLLGLLTGEVHPPGLCYRSNGDLSYTSLPPLLQSRELPSGAWDLLPMEKYRAHNWHCFGGLPREPYGVIYTSLGCPYNCSYCNIKELYNAKPGVRYRAPEEVVKEIDFLVEKYDVKNFKIMDELFTVNKDHVSAICDLLIQRKYNLNIWAYGRVATVDENLLVKMRKAGITWLCYGFESSSGIVRRKVAKRFGQSSLWHAVELTQNAGIQIIGNFIFGLPDDTLETMQDTLVFAQACNFEYVNFYCAMAYPGSQLYSEMKTKGVAFPETWKDWGQYSYGFVPLPTATLSSIDVLRFRDRAFQEYFNNPTYLQMMEKKFGGLTVLEVKEMVKHPLPRKILGVA